MSQARQRLDTSWRILCWIGSCALLLIVAKTHGATTTPTMETSSSAVSGESSQASRPRSRLPKSAQRTQPALSTSMVPRATRGVAESHERPFAPGRRFRSRTRHSTRRPRLKPTVRNGSTKHLYAVPSAPEVNLRSFMSEIVPLSAKLAARHTFIAFSRHPSVVGIGTCLQSNLGYVCFALQFSNHGAEMDDNLKCCVLPILAAKPPLACQ